MSSGGRFEKWGTILDEVLECSLIEIITECYVNQNK
jgi:hypothetical protein